MKHWNRRIGIKVLCFLLAIPLLGAAVLSGIWVVDQWSEGVYSLSRQELEDTRYRELMVNDGLAMIFCNEEVFRADPPETATDLINRPIALRYGLYDVDGNLYAGNIRQSDEGFFTMEENIAVQWHGKEMYASYIAPEDIGVRESWRDYPSKLFTLRGYVDKSFLSDTRYSAVAQELDRAYELRYPLLALCLGSAALGALCVVNLLATASRRAKQDGFFPGPFHKIPGDVMAAVWVAVLAFLYDLTTDHAYYFDGNVYLYRRPRVIIVALLVAAAGYICLGLLVGAVGRLKQGCLIKNTVIYKVLCWVFRGMKKLARGVKKCYVNLPLIWQTLVGCLVFGFWALLLFASAMAESGMAVLLLMVVPVMMGLAIWVTLQLRALQQGGKALAEGNLSYQVNTAGLLGALREHGENLNSIGKGMNLALEGRLKSERMKTELVTNVSHDIKNPLTSIINYASLIAAEECENENHREYAKVLAAKGEHLKRLLEDLVEISRATTGNMEIDLQPCNAGTFLDQLVGEFQERCAGADLTLIASQPESPVMVKADSRRIWRVFENLMQNACKYSLPGSRVYLNLEREGGNGVFTLRNTSKEPLNIQPEELMERFVRGDSARTTEGNGLGLSIAQTLTQAQGGEMTVSIDGDLFKVRVSLPLAQ